MRNFCCHKSILLIFFLLTINKSESLKRSLKSCQLKCNKTDGNDQEFLMFRKTPKQGEQGPPGKDGSDGKDGKDCDLKLVMDIVNRFIKNEIQVL